MYRCLLIVLSLGAAAMLPVDAAAAGKSGDAPPTCVTLSGQHKAARVGTDGMVVADDGNHLRLDFGRYCDAMMKTSSVMIATDGRENVVCTHGSTVSSRAGSCAVREMRVIDEAEYKRRARRRN